MINYSESIKWQDSFSCGLKEIDDQHKELIELINNINLCSSEDQEKEKIYFYSLIKELIKCVKIHLKTEERFLYISKYPLYMQHKKAHKSFVVTILDLFNDYKTGKSADFTIITNYVKNWSLSHITIMDRAYFEYFSNLDIDIDIAA